VDKGAKGRVLLGKAGGFKTSEVSAVLERIVVTRIHGAGH
jgi:hypothetical protein